MKRILFLLIALAVAALAGWYYWQFFATTLKHSRSRASAARNDFLRANPGL
jgi:hypothetical protein